MKYIVFWFVIYTWATPVKELKYDEFGRVSGTRWEYGYRYDSIPKQKEFLSNESAREFACRLQSECSNCSFSKIDSVKTTNK